ncbi:hypothetical protein SUGI_1165650 [Cryptomeria japonica]|uniref:uncharacterized protein LOC131041438 n=1 Tax=Cryptomeria japonica TaxID=3369 RepID=UPI002414AB30|nr:uncharacterized protein LOC131041438 [Cryptomeria japonica]GLJ54322.1 hypothetical protein SUGI_1165650 [Cryptomeria japonica]
MGNCVQTGCRRISQAVEVEKFINIMKTDGKILEYSAPLFVRDVLVDYECHAVVNPQTINQQLPLAYELLPGHMYCLVPDEKNHVNKEEEAMIKVEPKEMDKSKGGVVRLKVVIKRQQLGELLVANKGMSLEELVLQIQSKCHSPRSGLDDSSPKSNSSGWRPSLDSIPELHDVIA